MAITTLILYLAFLGQIFLLSYYYPSRFIKRTRYVLETYPPAEYPKLYPNSFGYDAKADYTSGLTTYKILNGFAILVGLGLLGWAIFTGYTPSPTGGEEVLIVIYLFIQSIPHIKTEVAAYQHRKAMHYFDKSTTRVADLTPRKLFDFVSPVAVYLAATLFISWLVFFIATEGPITEWQDNIYISMAVLLSVHIGYVIAIKRTIYSKKLDPHQATKDQLTAIETRIKMYVYSIIFLNLFMLVNTAIEVSGYEILDPIATTLYFQVLIATIMELLFRTQKIEAIDFEVYRETGSKQ